MKSKISVTPTEAGKQNTLNEEEEYYFTNLLSPESINFLIPLKPSIFHFLLQAVCSALVCGYGVHYLNPGRMAE